MTRRPSTRPSTQRVAAIAGAAIFLASTVVEIVRLAPAPHHPWPRFDGPWAWSIGVATYACWVAAAVALAMSARRRWLFPPTLGSLALVWYGLLGTSGRVPLGIVYLALGVVMPAIVWVAFGGKLRLWGPSVPPRPVEADARPHVLV